MYRDYDRPAPLRAIERKHMRSPSVRVGPRLVVSALLAFAALLVACADEDNQPATSAASAETATETSSAPTAAAREVEWGACGFQVPAGVEMECGVLEVPANREDPAAGAVRLHFGVVRTQDEAPADDPIVFLSGGPGQGALELVPLAYAELYEPLVETRDLVIVDQRGTGRSEPSLKCDEYVAWARETIGSGESLEAMAAEGEQVLDDCRERLANEGIDFANYNSATSAADLDALRRALGYEEWNLYGTSYGTRLALTAMRDTPDGIRSVVLDAAYPLEVNLYEEIAANGSRAIEALFAACQADAACAQRFPELEQTFLAMVDELNAQPVPVTVVDPQTGRRLESELSGDGLVSFTFQSLYATELLPFLPEIIAAASEGNFGTIGLLQGAFLTQLDLVSTGMQLAVQCQEEVAFGTPEEATAALEEHPLLRGFLERSPTLGPDVFELCERWEAGEPGADEDEPVTSDVPTLVLAGEFDPITPPRWGEAIAGSLTNSHFVEFPNTGHGVVAAHECGVQLFHAFLDDPATDPDSACIAEIPPLAFTADEADVVLVPVVREDIGVEGVAPEGWTEVLPGIYQESPLTALAYVVAPGATAELILAQVAAQMGADQPLEPVGQRETEFLTWDLYEMEDLGQSVDLAIAEHNGRLLLIQLGTTPQRRDAYYEEVFLPAVDAFNPEP